MLNLGIQVQQITQVQPITPMRILAGKIETR